MEEFFLNLGGKSLKAKSKRKRATRRKKSHTRRHTNKRSQRSRRSNYKRRTAAKKKKIYRRPNGQFASNAEISELEQQTSNSELSRHGSLTNCGSMESCSAISLSSSTRLDPKRNRHLRSCFRLNPIDGCANNQCDPYRPFSARSINRSGTSIASSISSSITSVESDSSSSFVSDSSIGAESSCDPRASLTSSFDSDSVMKFGKKSSLNLMSFEKRPKKTTFETNKSPWSGNSPTEEGKSRQVKLMKITKPSLRKKSEPKQQRLNYKSEFTMPYLQVRLGEGRQRGEFKQTKQDKSRFPKKQKSSSSFRRPRRQSKSGTSKLTRRPKVKSEVKEIKMAKMSKKLPGKVLKSEIRDHQTKIKQVKQKKKAVSFESNDESLQDLDFDEESEDVLPSVKQVPKQANSKFSKSQTSKESLLRKLKKDFKKVKQKSFVKIQTKKQLLKKKATIAKPKIINDVMKSKVPEPCEITDDLESFTKSLESNPSSLFPKHSLDSTDQEVLQDDCPESEEVNEIDEIESSESEIDSEADDSEEPEPEQ